IRDFHVTGVQTCALPIWRMLMRQSDNRDDRDNPDDRDNTGHTRHERTGPVSMDETLRMLKELTDAPGVPGFEREARLVMERYLEPLADEVSRDRLEIGRAHV